MLIGFPVIPPNDDIIQYHNKYILSKVEVIDGDTIKADIYLDFGISIENMTIECSGYTVHDGKIGEEAKKELTDLLSIGQVYITNCYSGEDGHVYAYVFVRTPDFEVDVDRHMKASNYHKRNPFEWWHGPVGP